MAFDYSSVDWWNLAIFPTLTTLALLFLYRMFISNRESPKNPEYKLVYGLCRQIRLEYDSLKSTVLVPVGLGLCMFAVIVALSVLFHHNFAVGFGFPTFLGLFISGILAPINEEIVFRGLIFWVEGMVLATVLWNFRARLKPGGKFKEYAPLPEFGVYLVLLAQAAIFSFLHFDGNLPIFAFKMLSGLVSGCLFYFNNKNLLPAMVFHAVSNAMVIIVAGQPLF